MLEWLLPARALTVLQGDSLPEKLPRRGLVILRDGGEDWCVGMRCPCGCGQRVELPLLPEVKLYGSAFFGAAPLSDARRDAIRKQLEANIAAFKRLAKFSPYVAGDTFTQADCAAFNNLPLFGMASKAIYGEDLLLAAGVDYKPYIRMIGERPSAQKVVADRKAAQAKL